MRLQQQRHLPIQIGWNGLLITVPNSIARKIPRVSVSTRHWCAFFYRTSPTAAKDKSAARNNLARSTMTMIPATNKMTDSPMDSACSKCPIQCDRRNDHKCLLESWSGHSGIELQANISLETQQQPFSLCRLRTAFARTIKITNARIGTLLSKKRIAPASAKNHKFM